MTEHPSLAEAWSHYYETLGQLRVEIEATPRFQQHPEHRPEAYHALLEAQAMAYVQIVAVRMNQPRVYTHTACNTTLFTLGQNCSDALYTLIPLDGRCTYRLKVRKGDIKVMLLQTYNHHHGHPDCRQLSNHDVFALETNPDGTVDILFSATRQPGNWIALSPESNYHFIQMRRFYADWFDDMGSVEIEMIGPPGSEGPASEAEVVENIYATTYFITYLIRKWCIGLYDFYLAGAGGKNKIWYCPGKDMSIQLGSPSTIYTFLVGDCRPDEAVVIEMDVPRAPYWGWQLATVWSKPLEIVFHQSDINMHRAHVDSDGKFRAVICRDDPGIANWLALIGGSTEYILVGRNYKEAGTPVAPATFKVVKMADLAAHLPLDTRKVTAEERRLALEHRREGNVRLYDFIQA